MKQGLSAIPADPVIDAEGCSERDYSIVLPL
jgi:hypothetical protein